MLPPTAAIRGSLASLDRSRDELAKAWLVRLVQRVSLEEIGDLQTERIAREVPELIRDILSSLADTSGEPYRLSAAQARRAAALAGLRGRTETSPAELSRDIAALQAVLVQALRAELVATAPERFADAVERLVETTAAIQAAAVEELMERRSRELESQAYTDPLTGLGNLRHLQRQIETMLALHKRYGHPFGVLLMDVDGLKRVNDAHGHLAGDRVLMQVAMSVQRSIRAVDLAARLGGDEFCVLAPQQKVEASASLAARLASVVEDEVATPVEPRVGLSIGVVACPSHGTDAQTLIAGADRAMYQAKATGAHVALGDPRSGDVAEEAQS